MKKTKTAGTDRGRVRILNKIRTALDRQGADWHPRFYLKTGNKYLDGVLGDPEKGLVYGKIIEVSGKPSNGKTALAIDIAAAGQAEGAYVIWIDFENSFDQPEVPGKTSWYERRGLECHRDSDKFCLIQPYAGKFKTTTIKDGVKSTKIMKRLSTAEELIEEAEQVLEAVAGKDQRVVLVVDSVTAMLPEDQAAAGITNQSMKTEQALPKLLGYLLRRWVALLQEKNALAIFINQLRTKPGISFGDPDYTPGGNALPFYCHVRVRARRKGKRLLSHGKPTGVQGILVNVKNKAGGEEGAECGFQLFWDGRSKFFNAKELKKEEL